MSGDSSPLAAATRALLGWRGAVLLVALLAVVLEGAVRRARSHRADGRPSRDTSSAAAAAAPTANDSLVATSDVAPPADSGWFTAATVEHPVAAVAGNPSPTYPRIAREMGLGGSALLQFVVDTTGRARMETVRVLKASDPAFARAVIEVLPRYQFTPATLRGGRRVPQIVQLPFEFTLAR